MTRVAVVTAPSTAIAHTGHATTLPPGRYAVVELDGAAERGETGWKPRGDYERIER